MYARNWSNIFFKKNKNSKYEILNHLYFSSSANLGGWHFYSATPPPSPPSEIFLRPWYIPNKLPHDLSLGILNEFENLEENLWDFWNSMSVFSQPPEKICFQLQKNGFGTCVPVFSEFAHDYMFKSWSSITSLLSQFYLLFRRVHLHSKNHV